MFTRLTSGKEISGVSDEIAKTLELFTIKLSTAALLRARFPSLSKVTRDASKFLLRKHQQKIQHFLQILITVGELSFLLGFSDFSNFSRAFKNGQEQRRLHTEFHYIEMMRPLNNLAIFLATH